MNSAGIVNPGRLLSVVANDSLSSNPVMLRWAATRCGAGSPGWCWWKGRSIRQSDIWLDGGLPNSLSSSMFRIRTGNPPYSIPPYFVVRTLTSEPRP